MRLSSILSIAALSLVTAAQAQTLNIDGMKDHGYSQVTLDFGGNKESVDAGPQEARLGAGSAFDAYCVDLSDFNSLPDSYGVQVTEGGSIKNSGKIAQMLNKFGKDVTNEDMGTALQVAIWDEEYNGGKTSGALKVSGLDSKTKSDLNEILKANYSGISDSASFYMADDHGKDHNRNQNLVSVTPAPEPASMLALGLGLVGVASRRRKAAK